MIKISLIKSDVSYKDVRNLWHSLVSVIRSGELGCRTITCHLPLSVSLFLSLSPYSVDCLWLCFSSWICFIIHTHFLSLISFSVCLCIYMLSSNTGLSPQVFPHECFCPNSRTLERSVWFAHVGSQVRSWSTRQWLQGTKVKEGTKVALLQCHG